MNIYHIGPIDYDYDEYSDFVVIAPNQNDAVAMAIMAAESNRDLGNSFAEAPVTLLGTSAEEKPRVVLGSFHAG